MFLLGIGIALGFKRVQRGEQFRARLRRLDYGVNLTTRGGDVGIGETLTELGYFFAPTH